MAPAPMHTDTVGLFFIELPLPFQSLILPLVSWLLSYFGLSRALALLDFQIPDFR